MAYKVFRQRDLSLHRAGLELVRRRFPQLVEADKEGSDHYSTATENFVRQRTVAYALGKGWVPGNKMVNRLFIETLNVDSTHESGGPWQAYKDGNNIFMYLFMLNRKLVKMDLHPRSIQALDLIATRYPDYYQKNDGYNSVGKVIPIDDLSRSLCQSLTVIDLA
jgi:hypothetical protein